MCKIYLVIDIHTWYFSVVDKNSIQTVIKQLVPIVVETDDPSMSSWQADALYTIVRVQIKIHLVNIPSNYRHNLVKAENKLYVIRVLIVIIHCVGIISKNLEIGTHYWKLYIPGYRARNSCLQTRKMRVKIQFCELKI